MISCDTPKDLRPEAKVSNSTVPPGMRNTYNVSDAGGDAQAHATGSHDTHQNIMPNHDQGTNTLQPGDSARENAGTINTDSGAVKR